MAKQRLMCLIHLLTFLTLAASQADDRICTSVTVRSAQDLRQLQNCTIVAGHVRVVLTQFTPESLLDLKPLDIEEITDYLLIYRAHGLDSLEHLLPKLMVIRGAQLLYDQYALVIHENRDMENIGLISLLRVMRGSVRIESNPALCYATTIDWVSILGQSNKEYHYILKNNKPSNFCPLCYNIKPVPEARHQHCWSLGKQQKRALEDFPSECPTECPSKKCNKKGKCCSGKCLTTCSDDNCKYCTNLISGKKCVDACMPPYAMAFKRQCVLDCHRYGLVRLGSECVEKCPKLYREVIQHDVVTACTPSCSGNFTIRESKDLQRFSDCTILQGSLTLELTEMNKTKINDLYNELSFLREITGYLKIIKSPQLLSLSFLRNLHTIGGNALVDNAYALYVVDNLHLEEIWNENQKVSISKGRIAFHLNPHLCYKKIMRLSSQIKDSNTISIMDVSPNSNGERATCQSRSTHLNVTIDAVNANEARVLIDYLTHDDLEPLIGYTFYYREAPIRNMSYHHARHACGHDDWFSETALTKQRRHVLRQLKPFTQYAYFVKTFAIFQYHYDYDAISDIQYFRTAPAKPGPVQKIFYKSVTAKEIELHWWPPLHKNGNLEKYLLSYEAVKSNHTSQPSCSGPQCKTDTCVCPKLNPELSGIPPSDEDFYNREYMIYETSLLNFIFVPAPKGRKAPMSEEALQHVKNSLERFQQERKNAAIRTQDDNIEEFDIAPVLPACTVKNPSVVYKKENNCTDLEVFECDYELAGDSHIFTLKQLQPQVNYRISLRACVEGLDNGCGPETILYAQTVSKSLENFLESLKLTPA